MNVREQIIAKTYWNNGELLPKCFSMQLLACLDTFAEPRRVVIAVRTKWTQCCFVGGQDVDGLESTLATCQAFGTNMSQTRSFTTRLYHLFQKAFAQIFAPTLWLLLKLILASQEPFLATLKQFIMFFQHNLEILKLGNHQKESKNTTKIADTGIFIIEMCNRVIFRLENYVNGKIFFYAIFTFLCNVSLPPPWIPGVQFLLA